MEIFRFSDRYYTIMVRVIIISTFLILFIGRVSAQHPIDEKERRLLRNAITTADMVLPHRTAGKHWDQLLNLVYNQLKLKLKPETFVAIKNSQLAWLKYRDTEIRAINQFYYGELQGTMWHPVAAGKRAALVKKRVLELLEVFELAAMQLEEPELSVYGKWKAPEGHPNGEFLEINDPFTLAWSSPGSDEYSYEFFLLTNGCESKEGQPDGKYLLRYTPGSTEANSCTSILSITQDQLILKNHFSNDELVFERVN